MKKVVRLRGTRMSEDHHKTKSGKCITPMILKIIAREYPVINDSNKEELVVHIAEIAGIILSNMDRTDEIEFIKAVYDAMEHHMKMMEEMSAERIH